MLEANANIAALQQAVATPSSTPAPNVSDVTLFGESMAGAEARQKSAIEAVKVAVKPLDHINNEAANIYKYAADAVAKGNELTPSEIIMLTARSQEFMFHCQLTSNVANRTSDGLQQLFRQQN